MTKCKKIKKMNRVLTIPINYYTIDSSEQRVVLSCKGANDEYRMDWIIMVIFNACAMRSAIQTR
jgi:hypothetical protein